MTPFSRKLAEIKHAVEELLATEPDWNKFFREVMGVKGLIRRAFPDLEVMAEFRQSETYHAIQRTLAELRKQTPPKEVAEDMRVITVRIPQSLHEALRSEAFEHQTTMNKLCISKLVQSIEAENVPTAFTEKKRALAGEEKEEKAEVGL